MRLRGRKSLVPLLLPLLGAVLFAVLAAPGRTLRAGEEAAEAAGDDAAGHARAARAAQARGDHPLALHHAERAFEAATTLEVRRNALRYLLILEISGHRYHAARRHLPVLKRLERDLGNANGVAACDVQIASVDASLGRLTSALAHIQDALAFFEVHGAAWERRGAHLNAGKIWLELRDAARSREHLKKAREAGVGLGLNEGSLLMLEGAALLQDGRLEEAAASFHRAESWLASTPESRVAAHVGHAVALSALRRHEEARAELDEARTVIEGRRAPGPRLQIEVTDCFVRLEAGDPKGAIEVGKAARRLVPPGVPGPWTLLLEARLARAWMAVGAPHEALEAAERATQAVLGTSGTLPDLVGAKHRGELADGFAWGIEAAALSGEDARFFRISEQARAVALRRRLGTDQIVDRALPPALEEEEVRLEEEEALAVEAYRSALGADLEADVRRTFEALSKARERLEQHRERIGARQALAGHVLAPAVDGLEETRARLGEDEALVVYASGAASMHALVVTKASVGRRTLARAREIEALVRDSVAEDPAMPGEDALQALARGLVAPLELPPAVKRIQVVPAGVLVGVPFGALWPDREVVLLPSATVSRMLAAAPAASAGRVLAVGGADEGLAGPLPGVEEEVRAVGEEVLVGAEATESAMREAVGRLPWRSVHLASHALIDPVHPMRSSLAFLPSEGCDGLWTVAEVLEASVRADLVVLSACSSGVGRVYGPEGGIGFVHAFLVAGARRVLASLWDVDDRATSALMRHFYAAWTPGTAPAAALRRAQESLRADPRWRHPAYWAGWQLWGTP